MSFILFKFKGSLAAEKLIFDGLSISKQELKNAIAQKKGLDTSRDQYVLLKPATHMPFPPDHMCIRNTTVEAKHMPLPQGLVGLGRPRQAADAAVAADDPTTNQALAAAQALSAAAAAADPSSQQVDRRLMLEMEAQAVTSMAHAAWQAQTGQHIRYAQQREQQLHQEGRGRGVGFGRGAGGKQQPPYCHNCGVGGQHWPHECPNHRSSLRQVRIPRGIPSSYLQETEEGGCF